MKRRWTLLLELVLLVALVVWICVRLLSHVSHPPDSVRVKLPLSDARDEVYLTHQLDGSYRYLITRDDGQPESLTPEQLTQRLYAQRAAQSWAQSLLNVSSPLGFVWVAVGFLGQTLFTGRMLVQWLASEKEKRSVVPPIFWWMSLVGSSMLLVYFGWRNDPVGLLGQAFGWFIYVRNLWMIYRQPSEAVAQASASAGS